MSSKTITIIFIVNGEDVSIKASSRTLLRTARNKALADSHNTGRPPEGWEIRDERGILLLPDQKIKSFGFSDRVRLFLTLKVGIGGSCRAATVM